MWKSLFKGPTMAATQKSTLENPSSHMPSPVIDEERHTYPSTAQENWSQSAGFGDASTIGGGTSDSGFDESKVEFKAEDIDDQDRSTSKRTSTYSKMANYGKGNQDATVATTPQFTINGKTEVGGQLLDEYSDRNRGEMFFPHLGASLMTHDLDAFYTHARDAIIGACQEFRHGFFKDMATDDISIQALVLNMQLSPQVTKREFNTLMRFGRVWAKAIGATKYIDEECKEAPILDKEFIKSHGLYIAVEDLLNMFANDKIDPVPFPVPEHMVYKSPAQEREKYLKLYQYQDEREAAKGSTANGSSLEVGSSTADADSSSKTGGFISPAGCSRPATSTDNLLSLGINKDKVLAKLREYDAAESKDRILRNAWVEISSLKGELTNRSIDKLSEDTFQLLYSYVQAETAANGKAMPMKTALDDAIARLEAKQAKRAPTAKHRSDIYVNAPKSTTTTEPGPADAKSPRPVFVTDKIKNKFGKKDKENKDKTGDENAKGDKKPDMRPGNAGADAGSSTRI